MVSLRQKSLPYFMWVLPLLFFAYQFILRLWPGLMMTQIMGQFSIDASHFGVLAAFYYYGYAGMQIPVAMLLDRYGVRKIVFVFAVLCGAATLLFTYTSNFYLATFSRFLIGAGSAVGFLGVSKIVSQWFPKNQYAKMIGLSFSFGLMGAIYGGKPTSLLIEHHPWQNVAFTLAMVSITVGVLCYFCLRSPTIDSDQCDQYKLNSLKEILMSPLIWSLAIANLLMVGFLEGFADVWGIPYLTTAFHFSKGDAASLISFIFLGMLVGGPLLAILSRKYGNYTVIGMSGVGMSLLFALLLMGVVTSQVALSCLFFAAGVLCCYQVIVFAAGAELVPAKNLGITVAFLNSINMLGGSFFHTFIGRIMDSYWSGGVQGDGIKVYDLHSYGVALSLIPICACVGALLCCGLGIMIKRRAAATSSRANVRGIQVG